MARASAAGHGHFVGRRFGRGPFRRKHKMNSFQRGMAKATELTRSGRLQEATDLIRSLVHPGPVGPRLRCLKKM